MEPSHEAAVLRQAVSQAKPVQKRSRRWLIVAAVPMMLCFYSWWSKGESIDTRLVGTWTDGRSTMTVADDGSTRDFCYSVGEHASEPVSSADGTGSSDFRFGRFRVRTSNDTFEVTRVDPISSVPELLEVVSDFVRGRPNSRPEFTGRVVDGGADHLTLWIRGKGTCHYARVITRIPE